MPMFGRQAAGPREPGDQHGGDLSIFFSLCYMFIMFVKLLLTCVAYYCLLFVCMAHFFYGADLSARAGRRATT